MSLLLASYLLFVCLAAAGLVVGLTRPERRAVRASAPSARVARLKPAARRLAA